MQAQEENRKTEEELSRIRPLSGCAFTGNFVFLFPFSSSPFQPVTNINCNRVCSFCIAAATSVKLSAERAGPSSWSEVRKG